MLDFFEGAGSEYRHPQDKARKKLRPLVALALLLLIAFSAGLMIYAVPVAMFISSLSLLGMLAKMAGLLVPAIIYFMFKLLFSPSSSVAGKAAKIYILVPVLIMTLPMLFAISILGLA